MSEIDGSVVETDTEEGKLIVDYCNRRFNWIADRLDRHWEKTRQIVNDIVDLDKKVTASRGIIEELLSQDQRHKNANGMRKAESSSKLEYKYGPTGSVINLIMHVMNARPGIEVVDTKEYDLGGNTYTVVVVRYETNQDREMITRTFIVSEDGSIRPCEEGY